MRERLPNQFPNPSTVKYSEISISFNGTRTNKLCAIRKRWLKTHCGAVDGKDIPLELQPLKNFIQKFCSSYSEDKHWEDPHRPIFVREVPQAVQNALPTMLQVAVWPIDPVKAEVPLHQEADAEQRPHPDHIRPSRQRCAPTPSPSTPPPTSRSPTPSPPPAAGPVKTEVPQNPDAEEEQLPNHDSPRPSHRRRTSTPSFSPPSPPPSPPPASKSTTSSSPTAPSSFAHPRVSPVEGNLKAFLAANPIAGTSHRELFTHLYNPRGGSTFTFFKPLIFSFRGWVLWDGFIVDCLIWH